jgi:hypothetical protein
MCNIAHKRVKFGDRASSEKTEAKAQFSLQDKLASLSV